MRCSIRRIALIACACLMVGGPVCAQSLNSGEPPDRHSDADPPARLDLAVTYNPVLANVTTPSNFGMQGASLQVQAGLWRGVGAVADIAGLHAGNVNNSGVSLDLVTATFGPRYTWSPAHHRMVFFGQALLGDAHALNGLFPSATGVKSTGNSFAVQFGGGINLPLWNHLSVRAIDAQWLRTYLPNATSNIQNNLRLGVGIIYRFK